MTKSVYKLSYDLKDHKDYPELYDSLEAYDSVRVTESSWLIASNKSATDIYNDLDKAIDLDDHLFIIKTEMEFAGSPSLPDRVVDWIEAHGVSVSRS